jgi:3-oxoacyl-[acyl-carrier-protein] synthase II
MLRKQHLHPFTMTATFPNAVSAEVAIALGVHGECETYSIGCSSTANAIGRAYDLIRSRDVDLVIAGGAEAPLHPTILSAMEAGRTLAPDFQGSVRNHPRPFDRTRSGIVMGEGAGCVVLEEYEHAVRRGAHIYAEIEGWAFTCDAHSMAKPMESGQEQQRAIEQALMAAHWFPEEVEYVNACGLGSVELDAIETKAIKQAMGAHAYRVPVSSLKGALGHAFAASGAFQVISTVLSLEHQFVPPTLNLTEPDPDCDLDYVPGQGRPLAMQRALINSFGFGGKNIVLALSRAESAEALRLVPADMDWEGALNIPMGTVVAKSAATVRANLSS